MVLHLITRENTLVDSQLFLIIDNLSTFTLKTLNIALLRMFFSLSCMIVDYYFFSPHEEIFLESQ